MAFSKGNSKEALGKRQQKGVRNWHVDNYPGLLTINSLGQCGTLRCGTPKCATSAPATNSLMESMRFTTFSHLVYWMGPMSSIILPILREASEAILEIYSDTDRFLTELKPDDSPLTAADHKSNQIIIKRIAAAFPTIPVISEESKQIPFEERLHFTQYFLVDPL